MKTFRMKKMLVASMCVGVLILGCTDTKPSKIISNSAPEQNSIKIFSLVENQDIIKQINTELKSKPSAAGGKSYYVCDTGDDNNDGKSEATPFRTYEKGLSQFNQLLGGESVLFCRGGEFVSEVKKSLFNQNCSASAVCTIGAYGEIVEGLDNRPTLMVTNATAAMDFFEGGSPDVDGGYVVKDLILMSDETTLFGVHLTNDVDHVTLDNLHIQGFRIGVYSSGAGETTNPDINRLNDDLKLINSTITGNYGQGWLGGCTDCLIENNSFINNGFANPVKNHNLYISGFKNYPTSGLVVRGNTLYKSTHVDGKCQGVSLVGHGVMNNVLIENNIIKEDEGAATTACWGIAIDTGYNYEEAFTDLIIRNNTVINVGGQAIGCSSCVNVQIEGNTVLDPAGLLYEAIRVPNRAEDSVKSKNVLIANNEVVLDGLQSAGIRVEGEHPFEVVNNKVSQIEGSTGICIKKIGANKLIETSTNQCLTHSEMKFVEENSGEEIQSGDLSYFSPVDEPLLVEGLSEESVPEEPLFDRVEEAEELEEVGEVKPVQNSAIKNTTYKPGGIFSSTGSSGSTACQVYARGRCLLFGR